MEHEQGVEEMEEQKQMRGQLNRLRRLHTAVFAAAFAAAMRFMLLPSQAGTKRGWIGEREERAPGKVAATFGGDWATIYRRATAAARRRHRRLHDKRTFLALITETNSKADEIGEKLRQKHQLKRLFHTV